MRRAPALVLLIALVGAARARAGDPPAAPAPSVIVGARVEVSGDAPTAVLEEAARLGDQEVPMLEAHFEGEVPQASRPLKVVIHATQEAFTKACLAEGGIEADVLASGGYTPRKTLVSHLYVQSEPFDTRRLVLHELTHQVQDKVFAELGPGTDVAWHREGLAEHFGWHVRERVGLRVGAVDALARSDRPSEFARRVVAHAFNSWDTAIGAVPTDYTSALGLVHALLTTSDTDLRDRFRRWEREAWRHRDAGKRFATTFEGARDQLDLAIRDAWGQWRPRWTARVGAWDEENSVVHGAATADGADLWCGWRPGEEVARRLGLPSRPRVYPVLVRARATLLATGTGTAGVQLLPCLQLTWDHGTNAIRLETIREGRNIRLREWPLQQVSGGLALTLECTVPAPGKAPSFLAGISFAGGGGVYPALEEGPLGEEPTTCGVPGLLVSAGRQDFTAIDLVEAH